MARLLNLNAASAYLEADPRTIKRVIPADNELQGSTGRLDPLWYPDTLDDWRELVQAACRPGRATSELRARIAAKQQEAV